MVVLLFCGIGEPLVSDEYLRTAIAKARSKVAHVSERTVSPSVETSGMSAPPVVDPYVLSKYTARPFSQVRRMFVLGITAAGGDTPRVARIAAIWEQSKAPEEGESKQKLAQLGESEEGEGK